MSDRDDYPDSRRGAEMAADRICELEADVERLTGDREGQIEAEEAGA